MKYDRLIKRVADGVHSDVMQGGSLADIQLDLVASDFKPLRVGSAGDAVRAYADKARETVMQFDIRKLGTLRELFPRHFPATLKRGKLRAHYDDNGDWAVVSHRGSI